MVRLDPISARNMVKPGYKAFTPHFGCKNALWRYPENMQNAYSQILYILKVAQNGPVGPHFSLEYGQTWI